MRLKDKNALRYVSLLLLLSALAGGLFPLIKIAEQSITPLTLAMLRSMQAAFALLIVVGLMMRRDLKPLIHHWRTYTALGAMLSTFFIAITMSEEYISASLASLLTCLIPIGTLLITSLILRWEQFTILRASGAAIALAGVAMFIGLEKIQFDQSQITGISILTFGYLTYAVYIIYSGARSLDPFVAATGTMVYGAVFLCAAAFAVEQPLQIQPSDRAIAATLVIGTLSTGLSYVLLQYLITHAGTVFAATSGYFVPLFAILASFLLVGETISGLQVAGMVLTLIGAWLVNQDSSQRIEK